MINLFGVPLIPVGIVLVGAFLLWQSINIVRPRERAIIERLGKYSRFKNAGLAFKIPFLERIYFIDITEQLADVGTQEIITKDNLNAMVDLQVYYKVNPMEEAVKKSQYAVFDYEAQIVALARTTMRNVIGNKPFADVNSNRNVLNVMLRETMQTEVSNWGLEVVRCELKEINPPKDVQDTMNKVLKALNEKTSAVDFATARETEADGYKRGEIKKAEGEKQANILRAEGMAQAIIKVAEATAKQIEMVNTSAQKYFVGNAQILKRLEVTQASLQDNSKILLTESGISPVIVFGDDKIIPLKKGAEK